MGWKLKTALGLASFFGIVCFNTWVGKKWDEYKAREYYKWLERNEPEGEDYWDYYNSQFDYDDEDDDEDKK